ncbi:MAG: right-handed parallel beta-helix repeat-containing protein [Streptomyces sp.]|uniref:right-handed parallel beta-helix repeat-containing protein n=1 Tax=Streptomyces sp. TaxID=1931 RepID=UPI0025E21BEB|nr:right-handed parallel beta-helix repeat-containing protein [Streptomyces sp.]MBW8800760.1 right-handed parallel beta-helix repeat-containing protein [Streptomyces sp.]
MRHATRVARAALVAAALLAAVAPAAHAAGGTGGDPDVAAWQRSGRPDRLMVIRPGTVALVSHGSVVKRLYPQYGPLPLSWLAANAGGEWIGHAPAKTGRSKTVRINTAVLLTPGTTLQMGRRTPTVLMTAGKTPASGTWIRGSRATLDIDGVTLASAAADGSTPAPADLAGRPYLAMGAGGRMTIDDAQVTGLGRGADAPARESGITWGRAATGSATGSTFQGDRTGLRLTGSTGVELDKVTVKDAVQDGVVLDGDRGTTVRGLTVEGSGGNGVTVGGTDRRSLSGVTTSDSHGTGIKATAQHGLTLTATASHHDAGGGVRLISCVSCALDKTVVDGASSAISVSGQGARVTVRDARLTGGADGAGVTLAADIAGATVTGGTISGFDRGIAIGGPDVRVDGTTVSGAGTGVKIYGHASDAALNSVVVHGGRAGVTASDATRGVVLTGVRISGVSGKGLASASTGLTVSGGSVSGALTAVDLGASARLEKLTVSDARRGMHLASGVHAAADGLDILAERKGIEADAGAWISITDSRVRAPTALSGKGTIKRLGHTEVTLPPFPWLGFAALVALTLAVLLQTVHQVRHRRTPRPRVAAHVRNTA